MKRLAIFSTLALAALAIACDPSVPMTRDGDDVVVPDIDLARGASVVRMPLSGDAESASSGDDDETWCQAWQRTEESWNMQTGEFRSVDECTDGLGDIARVVTEGVSLNGNGEYTTTYELRDGGEVVWSYVSVMGDDGMSQTTDGSSTEGETYHGVYSWDGMTSTSTHVHEEYQLLEGAYVNDGVYTEEGFFSGTSAFDDPATSASPDYTLAQVEDALMLEQTVNGVFEGWSYDYLYVVNADGSSSYDFLNDDLSSAASPDFEGAYHYGADGSGAGAYTQLFDEGSVLDVEIAWDDAASVTERWTFDDAATALEKDQEGELVYTEEGGAGSVTFFLEGGGQETCDLEVSLEGATTLSNCVDG